jgi:hypothetical protein
MKRQGTEMFSIFTQIEEVVANAMCDEGKISKIDARMIQQEVAWHEGKPAKFGVAVPPQFLEEFQTRIANLRA